MSNTMREILFRGKTIKDGKWVYGVPMQHVFGDFQILSGRVGAMCIDTVVSETIGQYTGLHDMDGNKIFEGDIIEGKCSKNRKQRFRVWWHTSLCCFIAGELGQTRPGFNPGTMVNYEVIGNVYDNPELLEENKI